MNIALKHMAVHFGEIRSGHKGIEHIGQLNVLIPYLKNLDSYDTYCFWELCNEKKWFKFRREYLDKLLSKKYPTIKNLNQAEIFLEFDKVSSKKNVFIDLWLNDYLRQDIQFDQMLDLLSQWLKQRQTIPTLEFARDIIIHAGKRSDLNLLYIDDIKPLDVAKEIMVNTYFEVSRRSLI